MEGRFSPAQWLIQQSLWYIHICVWTECSSQIRPWVYTFLVKSQVTEPHQLFLWIDLSRLKFWTSSIFSRRVLFFSSILCKSGCSLFMCKFWNGSVRRALGLSPEFLIMACYLWRLWISVRIHMWQSHGEGRDIWSPLWWESLCIWSLTWNVFTGCQHHDTFCVNGSKLPNSSDDGQCYFSAWWPYHTCYVSATSSSVKKTLEFAQCLKYPYLGRGKLEKWLMQF